MSLRVAVVVLVCALTGCGDKTVVTTGPAPACSAEPISITLPTPSTEDFSTIDPARCPVVLPEDFHGAMPTAPLIVPTSYIEAKNFYVLNLLETRADARAALTQSAALAAFATEHAQAVQAALSDCHSDARCWSNAVKWSDADIEQAGDSLVALHAASPAIQSATTALRSSGHAQLHAALSDAELLRQAWRDAAHALNEGWDDHVAGLATEVVERLLTDATNAGSDRLFFSALLHIVIDGLEADGRDESARYEPLAQGENAAAVARVACVNFSKYPFATIVVPGEGPLDLIDPINPLSIQRSDQAAARFAAGFAPFIVLSGGHVHPDRTPYSEAIEMKKYLMRTYGIPAAALIVDPHARHTTTNLRNVGRLLYRYGIPVDQPSLITSDLVQTAYIAQSGAQQIFGKRNLDELGYFPYRGVNKLDLKDDCFIPSVTSLHADATDLLDP